jgi:D-lactate dehydrogenase
MQGKPIALATEVNQEEEAYLKHALEAELSLRAITGPLNTQDPSELREVEILLPFIHSKIGEAEINAMPHLKLIATRSTGYEHIDLQTARAKGITVASVPAYGETAVAEYTFALLLTLSRKVNQAATQMKEGIFALEDLRGFDLYGKTLGVIGVGAIGLHVIRIAKGFGMHVLAYDIHPSYLFSEVLGFHYVPLHDLLRQSDIVTLHAPATPQTYHMINRETFEQMKRGAILINTARGSLVDTRALAWALETQILAAAGIDTIEGEEFLQREEELLNAADVEEQLRLLVSNHLLQRRPNVVLTPHMAFNSREALRRILDTTIANVKAYLSGHPQNTRACEC